MGMVATHASTSIILKSLLLSSLIRCFAYVVKDNDSNMHMDDQLPQIFDKLNL
jgi:hypothetical protein